MRQIDQRDLYRLLKYLAAAAICVLLAVPALCADNPVGDTPKTSETQKPGEAEKTGKTDESGEATETKVDLTKLSLEELMNVDVTIASKKPESILDTPSAVYVLTGDDIKRSGATNIPDALRLVPGVEVANIDAHTWAVSIRGFNGSFANKLLVLIDGRSVYTPQYGGVYWDVQDVVLEDVDRIEVIRGPGATMWGANAVNGVINIITKAASETQGNLVSQMTGTVMQDMTVVRHGGKIGKIGHFRVFGKYFNWGPFVTPFGSNANDSYSLGHGGFRADWDASTRDQVTLQGDIYNGAEHADISLASLSPPYQSMVDSQPFLAGWNTLGRWTRTSDQTNTTLQVYYDQTRNDNAQHGYTLNTFDIDFQQHTVPNQRHDVVWGSEYRLYSDCTQNTFVTSLTPSKLKWSLFSAFAQDEMTVVPNRFHLTVGSKFEYYYFAGWQVEPNIRFLWTPDDRRSIWAAISRAVRTPTRVEEGGRYNASVSPDPQDPNILYLVSAFGSPNVLSEELVAYELGYRAQANPRFFWDLAGFYDVYNRLWVANAGIPFSELDPPPPHTVIPFYAGSNAYGNSYGFELSANWHPCDWWRVVAGYSYLQFHLQSVQTALATYSEGQDPQNQFFLRSSMDLSKRVNLDSMLRYVDALPAFAIPSYVEMDLRLAWKPRDDLELSLVGQNLLQNRHREFGSSTFQLPIIEVPRSLYGKLTWTF